MSKQFESPKKKAVDFASALQFPEKKSPSKQSPIKLQLVNSGKTQQSVMEEKYEMMNQQSLPFDEASIRKKSSDIGLIEEEDQIHNQKDHQEQTEVELYTLIRRMAKSKQMAALCGLLGAFCIHLVIGAIYRWNMVTGYVSLYFESATLSPVGAPLSMFCVGLTMRAGYCLSIRSNSILVMGVAVFLAFLCTLASSFTAQISQFLLWHNALFGLAAGLLFLPPIKECHKFFPKMKLVTNSIILTGTGLGAVLFGASNIECIETETDFQIDQTLLKQVVQENFSICIIQMSLLMLFIGSLGVALMYPLIKRNNGRDKVQKVVCAEEVRNDCESQMLAFKSRVFWMIGLMIFLASSGNYYIIMNFKNLLEPQHQRKVFLYWILIFGAIGNGFSRIVWGCLFSRMGFKILFCIALFFNLFSFTAIVASNNQHIYVIFYTLNSVSLGGMMMLFPNICLLVYGQKLGESIYSYYWLCFAMANFFQFGISTVLAQNRQTADQYSEMLLLFIVLLGGSFAVCWREKLQGIWNNSLHLLELKLYFKKK